MKNKRLWAGGLVMNRILKNILFIIISLSYILLVSCSFFYDKDDEMVRLNNQLGDEFKSKYSEFGVYKSGDYSLDDNLDMFVYGGDNSQIVYHPNIKMFRLQNYDQYKYMHVKIKDKLKVNSILSISVDSSGIPFLPSSQSDRAIEYSVKVIHISGNKAWLWGDRLGFIIKIE